MKKILFAVLFSVVAITSPAETKQALTFLMESGARIVYFLDREPSIGFDGQTMKVTVGTDVTAIPLADVSRWEIGEAESGVEAIETNGEVCLKIDGNFVTVLNPNGDEIMVYDHEGRVVAQSNQAAASFSVSRGIYLISVANKTYKIAVR